MKRYTCDYDGPEDPMRSDNDGEYVRADEAQHALDAAHGTADFLRAAVEALKLERDQLRAALRVADALRNRERGMDKPERRKWRRE